METVYNTPLPHYYLSSVAMFLCGRQRQPYVHQLVTESFRSFIQRNLTQYDFRQQPVYFTGNIALNYADLLCEVCREFSFQPARIEADVLPGLVNFHTRK